MDSHDLDLSAVFPSERQRDAMLADVLHAMVRRGPMSLDEVMRECLSPDDVASLLPEKQRQEQSLEMVHALLIYLDEEWDSSVFGPSLLEWRDSVAAAKRGLDWEQLPPVARKLAMLYAGAVLEYGKRVGYIGELAMPEETLWKITTDGGDALPRLRSQLRPEGDA